MKMQVNGSGLIKNLGVVFSDSSKVLSELIQNGRRAGATEIHVSHATDNVTNETALTVEDNGCGIRDFQKLLTIAESGWDSSTTQKESPYGMGAVAMLFACEAVTIESGDQLFSFNCVDAIAGNYLGEAQDTRNNVNGCKITLHNFKPALVGIEFKLVELAIFSSVPIYLNGDLLSSRLSLPAVRESAKTDPSIYFDETELGVFAYRLTSQSPAVVLQDLLIHSGDYSGWISRHENLRPTLYASNQLKARMPDRDSLIDKDKTLELVRNEYRRVVESRLRQVRAELNNDEEFVCSYFDAINTHCRSMLNDIPCLPLEAFNGAEYPCMRTDYSSQRDRTSRDMGDITCVTPETDIVIFESGDLGDVDDNLLYHLFAWGKNAFELYYPLHPEHWIYKKRISIAGESMGIRVTNRSEPIRVATSYYAPDTNQSAPAYLVDSIELFRENRPDDAVNIPLGILSQYLSFTFDRDKGYYVQPNGYEDTRPKTNAFICRGVIHDANDVEDLLLSHAGYEQEFEWNDDELQRDVGDFIAQIQAQMGFSLAEIMERFLTDVPGIVRQNMIGKQFTVTCNADGKLTAKQAA